MLQWVHGQRVARLYKGGEPGIAAYQVTEEGVRTAAPRGAKRGAAAEPHDEPPATRQPAAVGGPPPQGHVHAAVR
eukprot:6712652-Prymnesium_polylepis.1